MAQNVYGSEYGAFRSPFISRVAWGALFAGVVAGFVTQVLLTMLGLAIGLVAFEQNQPQAQAFGIGSGIWLVLSSIISTFVGAWVATSLANLTFRMDGILHGILTWALMLMLDLFLLSTGFTALMGGAMGLTSASISSGREIPTGMAAVREQVREVAGPQGAQQVREAEAQVQEAEPEQVANVAAGVTWLAFITALLSLGAGALGGAAGLRSHHEAERRTV